MKVTIGGVVLEGTSDEIYDILNRLGYLSKLIQPIKTVKKDDLSTTPATSPYTINIPDWVQPYTIGDPPPGTYPQVWCGSGDSTMTSLNGTNTCGTSSSDDLDKLNS